MDSGWAVVPHVAGAPQSRDEDAFLPLATGEHGGLFVVTGALTVQFDAHLSEDDIARLLADHGLHVRRKLGFGGLYLVSGAGDQALAKAMDLNGLDQVSFAEPVLVEPLGAR
ncbi:hypothetical protein WNZ15_19975 [Roseibium sp. AS2]|uniref:S8 family serine peptidase n=1 Tax=Roseibium sp. AS2 TaxID=3135781 RepID=UPI00317DFCF8